jgi:hypothetical protein
MRLKSVICISLLGLIVLSAVISQLSIMSSNREALFSSRCEKWPHLGNLNETDASLSDDELFQLLEIARSELRIYIYDVNSTVLGINETEYGSLCRETPRGVGWDTHFDMEFLFPEYLKTSSIVTNNMEDADLFLIKHDLLCRYFTAGRDYLNTDLFTQYMLPLLRYISAQPAWKRHNGADHLFIYMMDNGIFCDEKAVHNMHLLHPYATNMTLIGNFGDTHNPRCFRADRDIVIPQVHDFPYNQHLAAHGQPNATREFVAYFNGQIVEGHFCSPGVRTRLAAVAKGWHHADADLLYQTGDMRQVAYPVSCPCCHDTSGLGLGRRAYFPK